MTSIQESFKKATKEILDNPSPYIGIFGGLPREFKSQQEADAYSDGTLLVEREHEELNGKIKL